MQFSDQDVRTMEEIHDAVDRLTAAATGLFDDWQQARSFLPSGCRLLMNYLTAEQTTWMERFEHETESGTAMAALESFERFAAAIHRRVEAHAVSPEALVGEVFENEEEERLFFRRWKAFLDGGIGTIARTFQIDDIIFAGQIVASLKLVGLLREIAANWAHLSPEHRHLLARHFRDNAQALSEAYGTASSADFILMKERFADQLRAVYERDVEPAVDYLTDEDDREATLFRAAAERFTRGVVSTLKSAVLEGERHGTLAVEAFRLTLEAGDIFLRLPGDDEQVEYYQRTLLPRLTKLLELV